MSKWIRILTTGALVVAAIAAVGARYRDYVFNPWTRDGQVQAQVIQIAPRVSGPIVKLPVIDNQLVEAGDVLFEIDPRTFEANLDQARANLDDTVDQIESLEKQVEAESAVVESSRAAIQQGEAAVEGYQARVVEQRKERDRQIELQKKGATSTRSVEQAEANYQTALDTLTASRAQLLEAKASLLQAEATLGKAKAELGAPGEDNPKLRAAKAALRNAELDLEFTRVRAPVRGYVTNLNLRIGTQAVANTPMIALVDVASFWVYGFFREDTIAGVRPGNQVVVTLMSYPDTPVTGRVESIGWGIAQSDGSTGEKLLPSISPTFEWIRLAQRIPARVVLDPLPEEVELRVGSTASVLVRTGTSGDDPVAAPVAAPSVLQ